MEIRNIVAFNKGLQKESYTNCSAPDFLNFRNPSRHTQGINKITRGLIKFFFRALGHIGVYIARRLIKSAGDYKWGGVDLLLIRGVDY